MVGGLAGAAAYMVSFAWVATTGLLDSILGGKSTLGAVAGTDYPALLSVSGEVVGLVMGVVFIVVAFLLPDSLRGGKTPAQIGDKGRHAHP